MARKWLTPVSIIVFVLGIGMVVWSLAQDSNSTVTQSTDPSIGLSARTPTTEAASVDSSNADVSNSADPGSGDTSVASTALTGAGTTATTRAPSSSSAPTSVAPSVTVRPVSPGVSAVATTTLAPLSVPPLALTPGVVAPPPCVSFADCAQKLFNEWLAAGTGAKTRARSYGTPAAVSALFEIRTISVIWDPTVYRSTALKYVAAATSHSKGIEFNFTAGQTGFLVQSVVWF